MLLAVYPIIKKGIIKIPRYHEFVESSRNPRCPIDAVRRSFCGDDWPPFLGCRVSTMCLLSIHNFPRVSARRGQFYFRVYLRRRRVSFSPPFAQRLASLPSLPSRLLPPLRRERGASATNLSGLRTYEVRERKFERICTKYAFALTYRRLIRTIARTYQPGFETSLQSTQRASTF